MPQISSPTPDATTTAKGKLQLAGDLAGTAVAPTLSTSAITLGYAQITADITTTSTTAAQATGLTATVTIPAGGRRVKITAFTRRITNVNTTDIMLSIWDGTVSSGTQLSQTNFYNTTAGAGSTQTCIAIVTPASGSKTYNVGFHSAAGTTKIEAAATYPAFIHVELA